MTDQEIIESMLTYGGSFVRALAECWRKADSNNQKRLKKTFADVWQNYEDLARVRDGIGPNASRSR